MLTHSIGPCSADTDQIICRCLKVHESTVVEAIELYGAKSWKDVKRLTGAGDGCTGCHCAIKELLLQQQADACGMISEQ